MTGKYKKRKHGVGIKEISVIKMCSYETVKYNKHKFDAIPNSKPVRYIFNDKIIKWYPREYVKKVTL